MPRTRNRDTRNTRSRRRGEEHMSSHNERSSGRRSRGSTRGNSRAPITNTAAAAASGDDNEMQYSGEESEKGYDFLYGAHNWEPEHFATALEMDSDYEEESGSPGTSDGPSVYPIEISVHAARSGMDETFTAMNAQIMMPNDLDSDPMMDSVKHPIPLDYVGVVNMTSARIVAVGAEHGEMCQLDLKALDVHGKPCKNAPFSDSISVANTMGENGHHVHIPGFPPRSKAGEIREVLEGTGLEMGSVDHVDTKGFDNLPEAKKEDSEMVVTIQKTPGVPMHKTQFFKFLAALVANRTEVAEFLRFCQPVEDGCAYISGNAFKELCKYQREKDEKTAGLVDPSTIVAEISPMHKKLGDSSSSNSSGTTVTLIIEGTATLTNKAVAKMSSTQM